MGDGGAAPLPGGGPSRWRGGAVGSSLGGGATAVEAEDRVGASRWIGEATGSSLGGGATAAEAEGRVAVSRWR